MDGTFDFGPPADEAKEQAQLYLQKCRADDDSASALNFKLAAECMARSGNPERKEIIQLLMGWSYFHAARIEVAVRRKAAMFRLAAYCFRHGGNEHEYHRLSVDALKVRVEQDTKSGRRARAFALIAEHQLALGNNSEYHTCMSMSYLFQSVSALGRPEALTYIQNAIAEMKLSRRKELTPKLNAMRYRLLACYEPDPAKGLIWMKKSVAALSAVREIEFLHEAKAQMWWLAAASTTQLAKRLRMLALCSKEFSKAGEAVDAQMILGHRAMLKAFTSKKASGTIRYYREAGDCFAHAGARSASKRAFGHMLACKAIQRSLKSSAPDQVLETLMDAAKEYEEGGCMPEWQYTMGLAGLFLAENLPPARAREVLKTSAELLQNRDTRLSSLSWYRYYELSAQDCLTLEARRDTLQQAASHLARFIHELEAITPIESHRGMELALNSSGVIHLMRGQHFELLASMTDVQNERRYILGQAKQEYETVIQIGPSSPLGWRGAGRVYRELEERDSAYKCFKKAFELEPKSGILHEELDIAEKELLEGYRRTKEEAECLRRLQLDWARLPIDLASHDRQRALIDAANPLDFFGVMLKEMAICGIELERQKGTAKNKPENGVRDDFIYRLRARLGLDVTAESINCLGKTDIRVVNPNDVQSVVIAECKYWSGPKHYVAARKQLLGYLSSAERESILLVFVRKGTSMRMVVSKAKACLRNLPDFQASSFEDVPPEALQGVAGFKSTDREGKVIYHLFFNFLAS